MPRPLVRLKISIVVIFVLTGCAGRLGEGWNRADTVRQVLVTGAIYYDLQIQTPTYLQNDTELNPIITEDNLNAYTAACIVGHAAISASLKPKQRKWWQWFWITAQGITIVHNFGMED